ncbi:MAG: hypothetical protein HY402_02890 [Elusimicrobia bacterium]|nr:hypothetical protein [Elusimicrobiota bacterium]
MLRCRELALIAGIFLLWILWDFPWVLTQPHRTFSNYGDLYAYHLPLRHGVSASLQEGRLPFWNPSLFLGTPLLANPQSAVLYPGSLLFYFLPTLQAMNLTLLAHLFLAALGTYVLARQWRLSPLGALWLAAAYALSPFVLFRIPQGVPTLLFSLSWIPWIWTCYFTRRTVPLGFLLALQLLSGHPQFFLINLIGLFLFSILKPPRLPRVTSLALAALLSFFLCLPQIYLTWEFLLQSVRTHWPVSLYASAYSVSPAQWWVLLWPDAFGNPQAGSFHLPTPSEFFESYSLYLGLLPLGFALWGLFQNRSLRSPLLALIAAGVFFASGSHNPLHPLLLKLPILGMLRTPARFELLLIWGLLLAAGYGWKKWESSKKVKRAWKLLFLGLTLADLLGWGRAYLSSQDASPYLKPHPAMVRLSGARIATHPDLNANKSLLYRLANASGYEAFYLARYAYWTSRSQGRPAADASRVYLTNYPTAGMDLLGIQYYLTPHLLPRQKPWRRFPGLALYKNERARPPVYLLQDDSGIAEVSWSNPEPERWIASIPNSSLPARLILSVPLYPGWRAYGEGAPREPSLYRGLLQSYNLAAPRDPGSMRTQSRIAIRYWPPYWELCLAPLLAVLACGTRLRSGSAGSTRLRGLAWAWSLFWRMKTPQP